MKKKEFLSKLKLQKTTIVSFNIINTIKGGTLQGADTQVVSVDGFTCIQTTHCIPNTADCGSVADTICTRPTNTKTDDTDFCYGDLPTKTDCVITVAPYC